MFRDQPMKDRFMKTNKKSGFTTEYNITHTIPDDYSDIGTQECSTIIGIG